MNNKLVTYRNVHAMIFLVAYHGMKDKIRQFTNLLLLQMFFSTTWINYLFVKTFAATARPSMGSLEIIEDGTGTKGETVYYINGE